MYSSEDIERLFIHYKGEAYPRSESIQRSATATTENIYPQPLAYVQTIYKNQPNFNLILDVPLVKQGVHQFWTLEGVYL